MNRTDTIKYLSIGFALSILCPSCMSKNGNLNQKGNRNYVSLAVRSSYHVEAPLKQEIPFSWEAFAVGYNEHCAYLKVNESVPETDNRCKIRLTTASSFHNDKKKIEISIPTVETILGMLDLQHSPSFQISELTIDKEQVPLVKKHGIRLKLIDGQEPVYFFSGNNNRNESHILLPHLFFTENNTHKGEEEYFDRLYSLNSIQDFGWMEGCVLDGLWQIYTRKKASTALETIQAHLKLFFGEITDSQEMSANAEEKNYKISSIESTLPFAVFANLYPEHPALKDVEDFWNSKLKSHGGIVDYSITAEGCYTVAYPMAVLSKVLKRPDLAAMALQQLRIRKKLVESGNVYLRYYPDKNNRAYKNWARGISWYMLGLIRTISILEESEDVNDLKEEFIRVSNFALKHQKSDGLWNCFIDDENTITDTSGSAGIAAAIASGISQGLLDQSLKDRILQTWNGLHSYLTEDGLLTGAAQSNSGGQALQRSDYRVISQMGMGLMGQLYAYID